MFDFVNKMKIKHQYLKLINLGLELKKKMGETKNILVEANYQIEYDIIIDTLDIYTQSFLDENDKYKSISTKEVWKLTKLPEQVGRAFYVDFSHHNDFEHAGIKVLENSTFNYSLEDTKEYKEYANRCEDINTKLVRYVSKPLLKKELHDFRQSLSKIFQYEFAENLFSAELYGNHYLSLLPHLSQPNKFIPIATSRDAFLLNLANTTKTNLLIKA